MEPEFGGLLWFDREPDFAVIGVGGLLPNGNLHAAHLHGGRAFSEEGDIEIGVIVGVGHARHLRDHAGQVGGTTRRAKPRGAPGGAVVEGILAIRRQRVDVKETVALKVHGS